MAHPEKKASWNMNTLLVRGGLSTSLTNSGTPTVPPIYASTTYLHSSVEDLDQSFSGTTPEGNPAFAYARNGNPSAYALEEALTQIEGGVGACVFSSGMGAIHTSLLAAGLAASGAKIVLSKDVYGPTISLLQKVFVPVGVEVVLADLCCPEATDLILAEEPDVVYAETISNPLVKIADLDAISAAAREVGAVTIVDSTFSTPYLVRPIEHGFDLVVHSATKYLGGHGDSTAGAVISGKNALLDQLRTYGVMAGAMLSPFEAHLILRGLRTLSVRMERQCTNTLQIARFLQEHPAVSHVYYPGLPNHPQHALVNRLHDHEYYGGLLAFELQEGSREAVYRFMNKLKLCLRGTSLGDVFTLVSYPPISSHRTLTKEELGKLGIQEGCVRLSVGIEDVADIIQDLEQALSAE